MWPTFLWWSFFKCDKSKIIAEARGINRDVFTHGSPHLQSKEIRLIYIYVILLYHLTNRHNIDRLWRKLTMALNFTLKDEIRSHSRSLLTVCGWHIKLCIFGIVPWKMRHPPYGMYTPLCWQWRQLPRKPLRATDHTAVFSEKTSCCKQKHSQHIYWYLYWWLSICLSVCLALNSN